MSDNTFAQHGASAVAVAVSGGADSLYALLALHKQGRAQAFRVFALHGIFLQGADDTKSAQAATAMRERLAESCARIGASLHTVDLTEGFSDLVIRPFVQSYALGLTPNPCALCNAAIKFGLLLDAARALGADRLATGHYARLKQGDASCLARLERRNALCSPALLQGRDPLKDQSYFLALVPQEALASALFPLGDTTKTEVLAALARHGLDAPEPRESQEVCFVPNNEYRDFIPRMAARFGAALSGPGPMLLRDGRRVGTHKGLWHYTEGQRKGLGVGWKEPLHVLAKEQASNILRLGAKDELRQGSIVCGEVNILLAPDHWPDTVLVKTRYREQPRPAAARLVPAQEGPGRQELHIRFAQPESAVAPGQIAAVYVPGQEDADGLRLAAGGVIM